MAVNEFSTIGVLYHDAEQFLYFCYNEKELSLDEFAELQYLVFLFAAQNKYRLFYKRNSQLTDIQIHVGSN